MLWPASPLLIFRSMSKKPVKTTATPSKAAGEREIIEAEWYEDGGEMPERRDLLRETIQAFRRSLKTSTPNSTTVGHLLQLMKLYKELIDEHEKPTHIQLIWNDLEDEVYD